MRYTCWVLKVGPHYIGERGELVHKSEACVFDFAPAPGPGVRTVRRTVSDAVIERLAESLYFAAYSGTRRWHRECRDWLLDIYRRLAWRAYLGGMRD
jgi:hypothetical protein